MGNELTIFENQLAPLAPRFAEVLGRTMPAERLIRTIVVSVERLPKLLECDRQSLFNAAMSAAVLGLEVDGVTGQAYLIPFKGRAQLVIGYKGYNTLAARSGITITGAVVREGDEFDYELGTAAFIRHRPKAGGAKDRRIIAAWACAQSMDRPAVPMVLGIDELMAVKAKSPGASRSDSPWNDPSIGFPAMCEKTAKRRLARSMPLNIMHLAARMDEAVDEQGAPAWIDRDKGVVVDGEFTPLPRTNTDTPTAEYLTASPSTQEMRAAGTAASTSSSPPHSEMHDAGAAEETTETDSERLFRYDRELGVAALQGTKALEEKWLTIAKSDRVSLKAALDKRHKPTALGVDNGNVA
jgi:recombination protein RecT